MTRADITRVRLPHTGLRVPDLSLTITGYKDRKGQDTAAFTANLRRNGAIIGRIENGGYGGETGLEADPAQFVDLDSYARLCRNEEGDDLTRLEQLLDALIDEHVWATAVTEIAAQRRLPMRLMQHVVIDDGKPAAGFPPAATDCRHTQVPGTNDEWTALSESVASRNTPDPFDWWQAWYGGRWRDVTTRPATIRTELYA
jgi:hypothetical protein